MVGESQEYDRRNREQRERLRRLGLQLSAEQWTWRLSNDWTAAAVFGHLGFWDRMALLTIERYERNGVVPVQNDFHLINAALATLFERLSPEQCCAWALGAAEAVDARIAALPASLVAEIIEKDGERRIHRYLHRGQHLDKLEARLRRG